jgi:hypothetical protein
LSPPQIAVIANSFSLDLIDDATGLKPTLPAHSSNVCYEAILAAILECGKENLWSGRDRIHRNKLDLES